MSYICIILKSVVQSIPRSDPKQKNHNYKIRLQSSDYFIPDRFSPRHSFHPSLLY